jgi:hypothetical protein
VTGRPTIERNDDVPSACRPTELYPPEVWRDFDCVSGRSLQEPLHRLDPALRRGQIKSHLRRYFSGQAISTSFSFAEQVTL